MQEQFGHVTFRDVESGTTDYRDFEVRSFTALECALTQRANIRFPSHGVPSNRNQCDDCITWGRRRRAIDHSDYHPQLEYCQC